MTETRVGSTREFGDRIALRRDFDGAKSCNSTDGDTCESLLEKLHEAQADETVIPSNVELALIVILERICGEVA